MSPHHREPAPGGAGDRDGRPAWRPRRGALAAWAALSIGLTGCGGGISIGFGSVDLFDRSPPAISLVVSSGRLAVGQSVLLTAAAADESGIDVVIFYRLDPGEQRVLGTIGRPPYELATTAPDDGRTVLRVFARAIDSAGNRADSAVIEIAIVR